MEQKTHWKKAFNSNYLGACDLPEYKDIVATIRYVRLEEAKGTKDGGLKNIAYFVENLKPMILNVENSETVKNLAGGSRYIEDWQNVKVQIYVKQNVKAFGTITDALRIRNYKPKQKIDNTEAIKHLKACTTLEELQTAYLSLDRSIQGDHEVIKLKDSLKQTLK